MGLSSDRVASFDFAKGFSILYVASIHLGMYWSSASWSGYFYAYYLISDIFAPVLFITMSILGTFASRYKLEQKNEFVKKDYHKHLAVKSSYFLLIGIIFNVGFDAANGFQEGGWAFIKINIFSAVVISQVITCTIHDKRPLLKVLFLVLLLAIKVPLERIVTLATGASVTTSTFQTLSGVLYFVLFVGNPIGLLDTVIVTLAVTLIAGPFVRSAIQHGPIEKERDSRRMVYFSIVLLLVSMFAGGLVMSNEPGEAAKFLVSMGSAWPSDAIPLFLVRHSSWNLLFKVSIVLSIIAVLYYIIDIKGKRSNIAVKHVATCGVYSFSIYVYHNIAAFVPLSLNWDAWIFASFLMAFVFVAAINAWNDRLGGVGSFEWGARQWVRLFQEKKHTTRVMMSKEEQVGSSSLPTNPS